MLKALDLFAGAGGLSIGLQQAGWEVVAAVELNADAVQTFARSHKKAEILDTDIQRLSFEKFRGIDLVAGGPPCQPFSSGGKRLAQQDSRDMTREFVRVIREVRPRAFLLENVPGLAIGSRNSYFRELVRQLEDLEYRASWTVLNAAEYGVPQTRRRLFVIGTRNPLTEFQFPSPTDGVNAAKPWVTSGSVLRRGHLIGDANHSKVVYAKRPDLRPNPYHGQLFNGGGRPIDLSSPCHTILASAGGNKTHFVDEHEAVPPYHRLLRRGGKPRAGTLPGARRLSVEESALIQTFPSSMQFFGSRSSQYTQIGNAVPPLLARRLGAALAGCVG